MLWSFSSRSKREEVERLAAKARFYRTLNQKLTTEINRARAELDKLEPEKKPIITEHPIDEELQTGESKLLGGGLQITAPWFSNNRKTDTVDEIE
jgi:hypothetical protein